MASSEISFGINRTILRPHGDGPYLGLHFAIIYVRDLDRSLRFYTEKLGFNVAVDHTFPNGNRWIEVAPPDGTAQLGLSLPLPGVDEDKLIGASTNIYFMTEDLPSVYKQWVERGVKFQGPPEVPEWGGIHTRFEDPDGNSFGIVGFDEVTRGVEKHRRMLTEKAERLRRTEQEIEIAKQVQARLFPQIHPEVNTLEYAGVCLQAREVGGDYFDFLDLGQRRLGLVIGDVSGKGIAAALLMANLQANLRSQCANALTHPELFLQSVNRLFHENTSEAAYASLFFAEYDDETRRLRYANCGHLAGLLLRANGSCERLDSTTTLLGLFREWECAIAECCLAPGDMLALYTDGVTEAGTDGGAEFGEDALVGKLHENRNEPLPVLVEKVAGEIRHFDGGSQHDDITLIVGKCR